MPEQAPIVIVGSGLAGYTLARELRKLDRALPVRLITRDAGEFYSKPMLSNALAQGRTARALVNADAAAMAEQLDIAVTTHVSVQAIDTAGHRVDTDRGVVTYRSLVLALGADPIRLPLAGDGAADVLSVNDLNDYARFRERAEGAKRVAILGAGLIGCEFANDLAAAGHKVCVIDPAPYPLASLVPEEAGTRLVEPLSRLGVNWRFGVSAGRVDRQGSGYRVALSDGGEIEADVVLSAVGLRPRTALAAQAGIAVGRGIAVDACGRTSADDVFALGDCAEYQGRTLPYVLPIMNAARALAQTLAGKPTPIVFPPMPVVVKTPACPVAVQPVPRDAAGNWQVIADDDGLRMAFSDHRSRMIGFALTGAQTAQRQAMTRLLAG